MDELIPSADLSPRGFVAFLANKWTLTGLSGIPYLGGPLETYISSTLAEVREQKWRDFLRGVEAEIKRLGTEKLDADYLCSPDFINRFQRIYEEVTSRAEHDKIPYLRSYLINCAWLNGPDITWKEVFFQYVTRLTGSHLRVLEGFRSVQNRLSEKDRFGLPQRIAGRAPLTIGDLTSHATEIGDELCELLVVDLLSLGLVRQWTGAPAEPPGWSISRSGLAFSSFILSPSISR
jgi:hypothetical protein